MIIYKQQFLHSERCQLLPNQWNFTSATLNHIRFVFFFYQNIKDNERNRPCQDLLTIEKVLANEDTLLRTHCCRHKCFPVCPRAQHLLRTQILCLGHKNVSDFVQKHFVSATNVSQFARARKRHEQQCFRNNVSSFATA